MCASLMIVLATICMSNREIKWQNKRTDVGRDMKNTLQVQQKTVNNNNNRLAFEFNCKTQEQSLTDGEQGR